MYTFNSKLGTSNQAIHRETFLLWKQKEWPEIKWVS